MWKPLPTSSYSGLGGKSAKNAERKELRNGVKAVSCELAREAFDSVKVEFIL